MIIVKAKSEDLPCIMEIVEKGRKKIAEYGIDQWQNGHPNLEMFKKDIEKDRLYVLKDEKIQGVFALIDHDYSYDEIDGKWLDDSDYVAVHRVAVNQKGLGSYLFSELKKQYRHIRVDTHKGNIAMNKCLLKNGFTYCGVISLKDEHGVLTIQEGGGLRNAYEYIE
ncbi:MAG: GNAT family N-acetyltransferase [Erysipelotrichaceae bacterium]|nr:GNAT family N-acetyltransferase [Erysipelotrichaceae bacterium]